MIKISYNGKQKHQDRQSKDYTPNTYAMGNNNGKESNQTPNDGLTIENKSSTGADVISVPEPKSSAPRSVEFQRGVACFEDGQRLAQIFYELIKIKKQAIERVENNLVVTAFEGNNEQRAKKEEDLSLLQKCANEEVLSAEIVRRALDIFDDATNYFLADMSIVKAGVQTDNDVRLAEDINNYITLIDAHVRDLLRDRDEIQNQTSSTKRVA